MASRGKNERSWQLLKTAFDRCTEELQRHSFQDCRVPDRYELGNDDEDLINTQLESGGNYRNDFSGAGTGNTGLPSHAIPEANLYMMEIDQNSWRRARQRLSNGREVKHD